MQMKIASQETKRPLESVLNLTLSYLWGNVAGWNTGGYNSEQGRFGDVHRVDKFSVLFFKMARKKN